MYYGRVSAENDLRRIASTADRVSCYPRTKLRASDFSKSVLFIKLPPSVSIDPSPVHLYHIGITRPYTQGRGSGFNPSSKCVS